MEQLKLSLAGSCNQPLFDVLLQVQAEVGMVSKPGVGVNVFLMELFKLVVELFFQQKVPGAKWELYSGPLKQWVGTRISKPRGLYSGPHC